MKCFFFLKSQTTLKIGLFLLVVGFIFGTYLAFDSAEAPKEPKPIIYDYATKETHIHGKQAIEIKITNLDREYNLKDEADKKGKKSSDYLNITKTKYYGDAKVRLMEKVNVTRERIINYDCNCRNETIKVPKNDSKFNVTVTKIIEVCDTCSDYENYTVEEFHEIDPDNYVLRNGVEIYEVFEGCTKFETLPDGSWGCRVFTDVNILGKKISVIENV